MANIGSTKGFPKAGIIDNILGTVDPGTGDPTSDGACNARNTNAMGSSDNSKKSDTTL